MRSYQTNGRDCFRMAKKSQLLGRTDPHHLREVVIGTVLSAFVFIGAFAVGDSAVFLTNGTSSLVAGPTSPQESCGPNCIQARPNDPAPQQPSYNPENRWPGPFDGYWKDGKWYANIDYNRDGKVEQWERDQWNATHKPITNEPITSGGSGGGGTGTRTSQNPLQTENAYMGGGCLSANPDDCY